MNQKEIRLECYKIAGTVKGLFSALKADREEIASELSDYCAGDDGGEGNIRLGAVRIAVDEADRRAPPSAIVERAKQIIAFVSPPPPVTTVKPSVQRQGKRGKGRTSR